MTPIRSKINRFFYRNQNKGIRNLMLYISIGNVIIYLLTLMNTANPLFYHLLRFDYDKLMAGQVWRLVTYPLVYLTEMNQPFLGIISLFFYYWCGTVLDQYWGALRFNLYYLCGVVLTDLAAILLGLVTAAEFGRYGISVSSLVSVDYVNMSLLLAVATVLPEQLVRIWFVIPVKMKWLAWLDVGLTLYNMVNTSLTLVRYGVFFVSMYLFLLIPLVAIVNYLLFFGKQAANILPDFLRYRPTRKSWKRSVNQGRIYEVPNKQNQARFRCTVCGRTELTNPGLEFRYCSKCAGYRCYCEDHIQNHTHITS